MAKQTDIASPAEKPVARAAEAREGFVGNAPFAKALLGPDDPIRAMKNDRETNASCLVLDIISDAVESKKAFVQFERCLIREATRIANTGISGEKASDEPAMERRPETVLEALVMALEAIAPDATVTNEKKGRLDSSLTLFTVSWNGEEYRVPVRESVMEATQPVDEIQKIARAVAIGFTKEDERTRRLSSRPEPTVSCDIIGVDWKELEGRSVSFDGQASFLGKMFSQFTYLVEGQETTWYLPITFCGEALLKELDSKIMSFEASSGGTGKASPIPALVIEEQAMRHRMKSAATNADDGISTARIALRFITLVMDLPLEKVPSKYRDACAHLNALPRPAPVVLSIEARDELKRAIKELDHPGYTIVRGMYGVYSKKDGTLDEEGKQLIMQTLRDNNGPSGLCERALRNLARAYGKLSGDMSLVEADERTLQTRHLLMVHTIWKSLSTMEEDGVLTLKQNGK